MMKDENKCKNLDKMKMNTYFQTSTWSFDCTLLNFYKLRLTEAEAQTVSSQDN